MIMREFVKFCKEESIAPLKGFCDSVLSLYTPTSSVFWLKKLIHAFVTRLPLLLDLASATTSAIDDGFISLDYW